MQFIINITRISIKHFLKYNNARMNEIINDARNKDIKIHKICKLLFSTYRITLIIQIKFQKGLRLVTSKVTRNFFLYYILYICLIAERLCSLPLEEYLSTYRRIFIFYRCKKI